MSHLVHPRSPATATASALFSELGEFSELGKRNRSRSLCEVRWLRWGWVKSVGGGIREQVARVRVDG